MLILRMRNLLGSLVIAALFSLLLAVSFPSQAAAQIAAAKPEDQELADPKHENALLLVMGAPGAEEYVDEFNAWAEPWEQLAEQNQWHLQRIDQPTDAGVQPLDQLKAAIAELGNSSRRLWIVMLGHGTYGRGIAKFNLIGPDVAASDLKSWLLPVDAELVFVNCSSASAPFLTELSGPQRIVITATRTGSEINFSRFGRYLSESIADLRADIDHDDSVSLLEAFLAAASKTDRFYADEARLATEHALLEDNADRAGTPGSFFEGIRAVVSAQDNKRPDGLRAARVILHASADAPKLSAEQVEQREQIEAAIDALRMQKSQLAADAYYTQLEPLMLELALIYGAAIP